MTIPLVDVGAFLEANLAVARPELRAEVAAPSHPIALLPVRLEARFFADADGRAELRVRVYPDKIHLDSHDPALTAAEAAAGRAYWEQRWRAASDVARHQRAWAILTDRFEPGRAAWIARALTPLNPGMRPAAPLPGDAALPHPAQFPDLGDPATITRTPLACAMASQASRRSSRKVSGVREQTGRCQKL